MLRRVFRTVVPYVGSTGRQTIWWLLRERRRNFAMAVPPEQLACGLYLIRTKTVPAATKSRASTRPRKEPACPLRSLWFRRPLHKNFGKVCRQLRQCAVVNSSREWDRRVLMSMRSVPSTGAGLHRLLAAIRRSPIVVRLAGRFSRASQWAVVRKSPDVDAYVLAWIASHVRDGRHRPRHFM